MQGQKREFSELSNRVIGCAIEVHRALGPGLLESTYQQCLAQELRLAGIPFLQEHPLPVEYIRCRTELRVPGRFPCPDRDHPGAEER